MSVIIISYLPTLLQQTTDTKTIWGTLKTDKKYSRFRPHFETRIPMTIMSWRNWQFITKRSEIFHDSWANIKMDFYKYCLSKNVYLHLFLITSLRLYLIEEIYLNTIKMIILYDLYIYLYLDQCTWIQVIWRALNDAWLYGGCFESCQFRPRSVFCFDVWTNRQATSGVYAITVTTSAYHSRRSGRL